MLIRLLLGSVSAVAATMCVVPISAHAFSYERTIGDRGYLQSITMWGGVTSAGCVRRYYPKGTQGASSHILATTDTTVGYTYRFHDQDPFPKDWDATDCETAAGHVNRGNVWGVRLGVVNNTGGCCFKYNSVVIVFVSRAYTFTWTFRQDPGPGIPPPATCYATQPMSIDFKTMSANDIPTSRYGSIINVSCTQDTKVRAKFVFANGADLSALSNGLNVKLRVSGWSGATGFSFNAVKDVPLAIDVNASISADGKVTEGTFYTNGVVKLSYD
ncbi:hypothetical protein EBA31_21920 [Serratia sp. P2ACOL2]|nr:hypothetical protein EBA31_21920 [Serratia sp. P2ACOL2]